MFLTAEEALATAKHLKKAAKTAERVSDLQKIEAEAAAKEAAEKQLEHDLKLRNAYVQRRNDLGKNVSFRQDVNSTEDVVEAIRYAVETVGLHP